MIDREQINSKKIISDDNHDANRRQAKTRLLSCEKNRAWHGSKGDMIRFGQHAPYHFRLGRRNLNDDDHNDGDIECRTSNTRHRKLAVLLLLTNDHLVLITVPRSFP